MFHMLCVCFMTTFHLFDAHNELVGGAAVASSKSEHKIQKYFRSIITLRAGKLKFSIQYRSIFKNLKYLFVFRSGSYKSKNTKKKRSRWALFLEARIFFPFIKRTHIYFCFWIMSRNTYTIYIYTIKHVCYIWIWILKTLEFRN